MMRSLDIGATGMLAQQLHVDVTSENIANMTTTGFKRQRPEFKDLIYQKKIKWQACLMTLPIDTIF